MYLAGYSLNNLTMMALTISTGFVVDDAIVMIENISRYIEEGEKPLQAALKGAEQIGFTILSLTVSLIAVLIPLLFMGDIAGRLFRQFAVTLAVTIVLSAFVSLTLTPMMSARLLRYTPPESQGRFYRASERAFEKIIAFYGRTLQFVLRFQTVTLLIAAGNPGADGGPLHHRPQGFFPDPGYRHHPGHFAGVRRHVFRIHDAGCSRSWRRSCWPIRRWIASRPSSEPTAPIPRSTAGASRSISSRSSSAAFRQPQVISRLEPKLAEVAGIKLYMQPVQDLTVDDRVSRTRVSVHPGRPQPERAEHRSARPDGRNCKQLPQLADVVTDQQLGGLAESLAIDRATASRFGITPATIDNTLYDAFGQRQINTLYTQLNQYHVILETDPKFQLDPQQAERHLHPVLGHQRSLFHGLVATPPDRLRERAPARAASSGNALLTPSSSTSLSTPASTTSALAPGNAHGIRSIERQLHVGAVRRLIGVQRRQRPVQPRQLQQHLLQRQYLCRAGPRARHRPRAPAVRAAGLRAAPAPRFSRRRFR